MKKKILSLVAVVAAMTMFLVACGGSSESKDLKTKDFDEIKMSMTKKELEEKLGKPKKVVDGEKDEKKAQEFFEKDSEALTNLSEEDAMNYMKFVGTDGVADMMDSMNEDSKLVVYQYDFKDEDGKQQTKNIYLVDDKVIFMSFN